MNNLLQNYQPYLKQIKQIGIEIYKSHYFQQAVLVVTVIIFFIIGRMTYQKRLTNLLQMVNDAQTTRKALKHKLQKHQKRLNSIKPKKRIVWIIGAVVIVGNVLYFYLTKKIVPQILICTIVPFILLWILYQSIVRWMKWNQTSTQKRLKNTSLSAQYQIKEILKIFGDGLKNKLKSLYESQIESQWTKQSKQECKLYKCYNQKRAYQDLYKLYEEIINQIKKCNMCDICLSQSNISVQKLGISELENNIKNFKRIKSGKMSLAQKKQMVNRLLAQYQKFGEKLPNVCKKGCCIKQRVLIQNTRNKYHDRLKQIMSTLSQKK